ncbi:hypothetical protein [Flavobacterium sp.]|uniref:hypothetical protein n=1 Tax=Flavobacterium sp. TaxID=239 RepID=UPI00391B18D6
MQLRNIFLLSIVLSLIVSCGKEKKTVGGKIEGDFNGDGETEIATLSNVSAKKLDDVILLKYSVEFSDLAIKPLELENVYRKLKLINEGDLNGDNADDISISYEIDPSVPIARMETRSLSNDKWNYIIQDMTVHFGFDTLSSKELQDIVKRNDKSIEYYTYGNSFQFDNNFKPKNLKKTTEKISLK